MSIILALDTSSEACSCAINIKGSIVESFEIIPRQHANKLLPMIELLLQDHSLTLADLDAIGVGCGPGSFTGLRIAAGVAQGLAFGMDIPVIPVSSLATLALRSFNEFSHTHILSCIDARINEVYWGVFEIVNSSPQLIGKENLSTANDIDANAFATSKSWHGVGSGLAFLENMDVKVQELLADVKIDVLPHAADVAFLASSYLEQGLTIAAEELSPVYLRDKVTHN